jgi:hypothetical protein
MAHQATLPAGTTTAPVPAGSQQAESMARDILALMQSEIDTQVEWRVQQAVQQLRAEGIASPAPQMLDPEYRRETTGRMALTLIFGIPIIAIAGGIAGPVGLILALVALVLINLPWLPEWIARQQRRR